MHQLSADEHTAYPLGAEVIRRDFYVDGRLRNSSMDFNGRHPIILPRSHSVTIAIITHFHERNLHTGPRALLSIIRPQYWPIGGRKTKGREGGI